MASNLIAMASNLTPPTYKQRPPTYKQWSPMISNILAMASKLTSNGLQPNSNGLQPKSNCLQPHSDGLQPTSNGLQPNSDGLQPNSNCLQPTSNGQTRQRSGTDVGNIEFCLKNSDFWNGDMVSQAHTARTLHWTHPFFHRQHKKSLWLCLWAAQQAHQTEELWVVEALALGTTAGSYTLVRSWEGPTHQ